MKVFIIVLGLLLLTGLMMPASALAASQWAPCGVATVALAAASNTAGANGKIVKGERECFYFNADEDSDVFHVMADTALICLDSNVADEGASGAAVMIRRCNTGATTYDANTCIEILDSALTGLVGAAGTQNACIRVSRGSYVSVNDTTAGTEEAVVSIEGE